MLHVGLYKDSKWGFWYVDVPAALSPTGRRWRRSTGSRDKRTAEKIRAQVEEGRLDALLGGKSLRSRQDFEKAYFEFLEVSDAHGPRTVDLYKEIIPRVLDACSWPPTEEELLRYWKGRMEADKRRILPITANKERRAFHAALQWAVDRDMIPSNPCSGVPWFELKEGQREVRDDTYTDEEVAQILEWLPIRYRPLVLWAWSTGMRLSECLNLRWEDLDTRVRVRGKGRKVRYLPMSKPMIEILQGIPQTESGPFPFIKDTVSQAFRRARHKAGIHKGEFHALRDTFARNFLTRYGGDIYRLAKILGHSSVRTTEKYYAHLVPGDLKSPMDAADPVRLLSDNTGVGEKQKGRNPRN